MSASYLGYTPVLFFFKKVSLHLLQNLPLILRNIIQYLFILFSITRDEMDFGRNEIESSLLRFLVQGNS